MCTMSNQIHAQCCRLFFTFSCLVCLLLVVRLPHRYRTTAEYFTPHWCSVFSLHQQPNWLITTSSSFLHSNKFCLFLALINFVSFWPAAWTRPWEGTGAGDCAALTTNSRLIKQHCSEQLKFICHRNIGEWRIFRANGGMCGRRK